jgi:hypothetical protein
LPITAQFVTKGEEKELQYAPPPKSAELSMIAQFVIEGEEELQRKPPP